MVESIEDLTGTIVRANAPIGMFSGCDYNATQNIHDYRSDWVLGQKDMGRQYVIMAHEVPSFSYEKYVIVSATDNTTVIIYSHDNCDEVLLEHSGDSHVVSLSSINEVVVADKLIVVVHLPYNMAGYHNMYYVIPVSLFNTEYAAPSFNGFQFKVKMTFNNESENFFVLDGQGVTIEVRDHHLTDFIAVGIINDGFSTNSIQHLKTDDGYTFGGYMWSVDINERLFITSLGRKTTRQFTICGQDEHPLSNGCVEPFTVCQESSTTSPQSPNSTPMSPPPNTTNVIQLTGKPGGHTNMVTVPQPSNLPISTINTTNTSQTTPMTTHAHHQANQTLTTQNTVNTSDSTTKPTMLTSNTASTTPSAPNQTTPISNTASTTPLATNQTNPISNTASTTPLATNQTNPISNTASTTPSATNQITPILNTTSTPQSTSNPTTPTVNKTATPPTAPNVNVPHPTNTTSIPQLTQMKTTAQQPNPITTHQETTISSPESTTTTTAGTTTTQSVCPPSAVRYNHQGKVICYWAMDEATLTGKQQLASDFCTHSGGHLPIIPDAGANAVVKDLISGRFLNFFLNYKVHNSSRQLKTSFGDIQDWANGLNTTQSSHRCVLIDGTGTWATSLCDTSADNGVICSKCEVGDSSCYAGNPYCSPCSCSNYIINTINITKELQENLDSLKKKTSVNRRALSSSRRRITCAEDSRKSSAAMGYMGASLLTVVFGGLFLLDIPLLFLEFKTHILGLCHG
ncbi:putative GPI-anchored protein pfl2 [Pecten maximus]|uniref:putative GPI-anchored protein pfl2 n=1 Tax=Pecten maximus TaxID=6579 RepID=UPI001459033A|nr:putative GPI-anchored protein pfl2 [Pecten maximus]